MGVCVPEALGGAGADYLSYVLVIEEISRADAGVGVTLAVHTSAGTLPIVAHGTPEQQERLVPPLAAGASWPPSRSPRRAPDRTRPPSARAPATGASAGREAVGDQRLARRHDPRLRARGGRHHRPRRARRRPGPAGRARGGQARPALLLHRRPRPRGRRPRRCWASRARACAWRSRRSTRAGSGSPRRPSGSPRRRSTSPRATRASARPSAARSRASRPSSTSWPTCRRRSRRPAR